MQAYLAANTAVAHTREHYAGLIRADLQKSVEGIIAAGRHLQEAKDNLEHGDFLKMIEADLPFGTSTTKRLMKIARHPVLSDSAHGPNLPASWRTLYELTKLPEKELEAKLIDGTITTETERKDVMKLLPKQKAADAPIRPKQPSGQAILKARDRPGPTSRPTRTYAGRSRPSRQRLAGDDRAGPGRGQGVPGEGRGPAVLAIIRHHQAYRRRRRRCR